MIPNYKIATVGAPCAMSNPVKDDRLGPVDTFWHVLNFFGPAIGLALIAPALAKLLWRKDLKGARWTRLAAWVFGACAGVSLAGLVVFGHDGKMVTYAAMVGVCALTLWWAGFVSKSR